MERKLADIISLVFHPVLMPSLGSYLMLFHDGYLSLMLVEQSRWMILLIVFIMTFLLPLVMIFMMKKFNLISSMRIEKREERSLPFLITGFSFYLTYLLIRSYQIPGYYSMFFLGATLLIVIALVINRFWKISMHMMALGGLTGVLIAIAPYAFGLSPVFVYALIMVAGITGFARLRLHAHSPAQVYSGFGLGLAFMLGLFFVFL
ncbi:MAG: hypothetical protein R6T91_06900 [Bacteroidales bacterium]